jgi:WD40 repeat protein
MIQGIKNSKSVDKLIIMESKELLLSMTCDQWLRFWVLDDLKETKVPCFRINANHPNEEDRSEENLTAIAVSEDCDAIITGDTSGQMKMWDVSKVNFEDQKSEKFFIERYFI